MAIQTSIVVKDFIAQATPKLLASVPPHVDGPWLVRQVQSALENDPKLLQCGPRSILTSIVKAASLGLEPNTPLQHCYLIPRGGECTLAVGYEGLLALAFRTGLVEDIDFRVVREGDDFEWRHGIDRDIKHSEHGSRERKITHAYAIVRYKTGGCVFEVLDVEEIERRRHKGGARGRENNSPAWSTEYAAMAAKTAWIALSNRVPMAAAAQVSQMVIAEPTPEPEQRITVPSVANDIDPLEADTEFHAAEPMACLADEPGPEMTPAAQEAAESLEAGEAQVIDMVMAKEKRCVAAGITLEIYETFERDRSNAYNREFSAARKAGTLGSIRPYTSLKIGQVASIVLKGARAPEPTPEPTPEPLPEPTPEPEPVPEPVKLKPTVRTGPVPKGLRGGVVAKGASVEFAGRALSDLSTLELTNLYRSMISVSRDDNSYIPLLNAIGVEGKSRAVDKAMC